MKTTTTLDNMLDAIKYDDYVVNSTEAWSFIKRRGEKELWHYTTKMLKIQNDDKIIPINEGWGSVSDKQGINKIMGEKYKNIFKPLFDADRTAREHFENINKPTLQNSIMDALNADKEKQLLENARIHIWNAYSNKNNIEIFDIDLRTPIENLRTAIQTPLTMENEEQTDPRLSLKIGIDYCMQLSEHIRNNKTTLRLSSSNLKEASIRALTLVILLERGTV